MSVFPEESPREQIPINQSIKITTEPLTCGLLVSTKYIDFFFVELRPNESQKGKSVVCNIYMLSQCR